MATLIMEIVHIKLKSIHHIGSSNVRKGRISLVKRIYPHVISLVNGTRIALWYEQ